MKTFGEGRRCKICSKILSVYNKTDKCFAHNPKQRINAKSTANIIGSTFGNLAQATFSNENGGYSE